VSALAAVARPAAARAVPADRAWLRRLHVLLGVQSLLLVLASVNRLSSLTTAEVLPHGSLRVVEVLNLLVIPPLSALAFYLLLEHLLERARPGVRRALRLGFLASLYLFAVSYGIHEPANFLHERDCSAGSGPLCEAIAYHDDGISHLLFFAGFAGIAAVLLLAQAAARPVASTRGDLRLVLANAALVAAAIVANLAFEPIGLDLLPVAAIAALAAWLLRRHGPRPVTVYFAASSVAGLVVVTLVQAS
jgi:hypothetical protein